MNDDVPRPSFAVVVVTQALLGAIFVVGVGLVALLPGFSASLAERLPAYASLRTPLLALSIAIAVVAVIVLAVVSVLVQRIYAGSVLTRSTLRWVDVIIAALFCAAALVAAGFVVISVGQAGNPALALVQVMSCFGFAAVACVTLVLRFLLRHAILIRAELDEVV